MVVRATDGGGLFDTVEVIVDVTNVNERPVWVSNYSPEEAVIPENAASAYSAKLVDGSAVRRVKSESSERVTLSHHRFRS